MIYGNNLLCRQEHTTRLIFTSPALSPCKGAGTESYCRIDFSTVLWASLLTVASSSLCRSARRSRLAQRAFIFRLGAKYCRLASTYGYGLASYRDSLHSSNSINFLQIDAPLAIPTIALER